MHYFVRNLHYFNILVRFTKHYLTNNYKYKKNHNKSYGFDL
jgi:hypothetical protein